MQRSCPESNKKRATMTPVYTVALSMLCLVFIGNTESKVVVFLPMPFSSHVRLHAFVASELSQSKNHTVWVGLSSAMNHHKLIDIEGVNTFSFSPFFNTMEDDIIKDIQDELSQALSSHSEPIWSWLSNLEQNLPQHYYHAMKHGGLIEYVESLKPDLIVFDFFPDVHELVAIPFKLDKPFAILSAFISYTNSKIPFNPVAEAYRSPFFRNGAGLFQQMRMIIDAMSPLFLNQFNDRGYMKQLFPSDPNVPSSNELISQAEVFIFESDPIFDYPRPVVPNVKLAGGMCMNPSRDLQEPFKSFMQRSQQAGIGVIVFSFGSLILDLPKELKDKFIDVLSRLKLNTIWRTTTTSPDPDKILTSTWIPQNDLLGHPNVKLFISHAGAHSLYEALYHGVPTLCLPFFYDQPPNAARFEAKGFGLSRNVLTASADELVETIEAIVSNQSMKASLSRASELYRLLHPHPRQEAAFWLDHVMQYGGSYMRYSGQKLSRHWLIVDYVLVFVAGVFFTTVLFLFSFLIFRKVCYRRHSHLKAD